MFENASGQVREWRENNWPPKMHQQYEELPIFSDSAEIVRAFERTISDPKTMHIVNEYVQNQENRKHPRWMLFPKVIYDVVHVNIAKSAAKVSKKFTTLAPLLETCGSFTKKDIHVLKQWLVLNPNGHLVAHLAYIDIRAYVFTKDGKTHRVRFYESGLILGADKGSKILYQDKREDLRKKRNDALENPLATNSIGWKVYGKL